MSCCRSNVARLGPPDPVLVRYSGSDAAAPLVSYIVCIIGWVPKRYEQYFCAPRDFSFSVRLFESYLVEYQFLSFFPALYDLAVTFYSFKIQFLKIFVKRELLTYIFEVVMSRRRSNVARLGPPDPVLVRYAIRVGISSIFLRSSIFFIFLFV